MGPPTRLHGVSFADLPKAVEGFCPICNSITTWKLIAEGDKYYKRCEGCKKQKKEVKDDELKILADKEKASKLKAENRKKENTKGE